MLETVWESRWLPDYKENKHKALDTLVLPVNRWKIPDFE